MSLYRIITILIFFVLSCTTGGKVQELETGNLIGGKYYHSSLQSANRGTVSYNVYLPPNWSADSHEKYPLVLLLHGQFGDEHSFLDVFPQSDLNTWIDDGVIPEMVIIGLNGGYPKNDMQWYYTENDNMISSLEKGELRQYCASHFNTTLESSKISIIGHSRGATGAMYFAMKYPSRFASVLSVSFVSDYMIERLKKIIHENLGNIHQSEIEIDMIIGSEDEFVLQNGRSGSVQMSEFLKENNISHHFEILNGKKHGSSSILEYPTNLNCLSFIANSWQEQDSI